MPRERTGTVWRSEDKSELKIRITVVDALGKKRRPWLPLNPALTDDAARRIAAKVSKEAEGKPWEPGKFERVAERTELTCDEYFAKLWIPSRAKKIASLRSDIYRWRKHVGPAIGSKAMTAITSDDLRDLVQVLDAKAEKGGGTGRDRFGRKSACNCWALVSKMFGDACSSKLRELRLLTRNPAEGVKPPEPPEDIEKQWLFPKELDQLLSCAAIPLERRRFYAISVYCYTRPGEALAFLWGRSIDLPHSMVRVNRAYDHVGNRYKERTKTGDSRHFAIEPVLRPLLARMWAEHPRPGLVFPRFTHLAERLREDLMMAGVTRAALHVRRPGSQPLRFHDLRATGITYMAIRGDSDQDVRERAGHADFETTLLYIRRGHLALASGIGVPYAALPACLLGESSQESSTGSSETQETGAKGGAGEGIRIPDITASAGQSTSNSEGNGTAHSPLESVRTLQDDSQTFREGLLDVNQHRLKRLERLAALDASAGPALAACRALDAAYSGDLAAAESALTDMASALGEGAGAALGGRP